MSLMNDLKVGSRLLEGVKKKYDALEKNGSIFHNPDVKKVIDGM